MSFLQPEAPAEAAVALLKALSHVGRLQILCLLIERPMNVTEIALALGQAQAPVSQQLMRLRAEGFVRAMRQGKTVTYALDRPDVVLVIQALARVFKPG